MNQLPDLVPARMVNEFTYCPRLFYLEWVDSLFTDNPDTASGSYQHRAVDVERGRIPPPGDPFSEARSVLVSSERLGLIARVDIVEWEDGRVRVVDIKKGQPRDDGDAWLPERVQLCVTAMILEDNGYDVSGATIYFIEPRKRVEVVLDNELRTATTTALQELRATAAQPDPPPPLVDSPRCPRCSLVGICLPDETNQLAARSGRKPRRLLASASAARPLYVGIQGAKVGVSGGRITVKSEEEKQEVRFIDISQICLQGNVQISTQALHACFREDIPVVFLSYGGWFSGIAEGLPGKNVELRRRQAGIGESSGLPSSRAMVAGKIRNCRTILRRNARDDVSDAVTQLGDLVETALIAESPAQLLGVEGTAARIYFSKFPALLSQSSRLRFDFQHRNRRPPRDEINALLSYAYTLLVKDLTAAVRSIGLDPYMGAYHKPRFGRPALSLDLAEEFRPLVADSVVVGSVNNGEIKSTDFTRRAAGVTLTKEGRRSFIRAYERRLDVEIMHPIFGYRLSYRRLFELQARLFAAWLMKDIPEYVPFVTR